MAFSDSSSSFDTSGVDEKLYWKVTLWTTVISTLLLFIWSAYRHSSFRSEAFDLGIFDQALWLISKNQIPYSSLLERHILGDHFALILYPLALLYKVFPSVYWLFLIQALSLSGGAPLLYLIARKLHADACSSCFVAVAYLCHPIISNVNLYDFHPECLAVPFLFVAILAALNHRYIIFILSLLVVISCKEILTLTVVGLGIMLLTPAFKVMKKFGLIAILTGIISFAIILFIALPTVNQGNTGSAGLERYGPPGATFIKLLSIYLTEPNFVFARIHLGEIIQYLFKLLLPYFFALSPGNLWVLVGAAPAFVLNVLSDLPLQRGIRYQYSLPILPFLGLMVAVAVSNNNLLVRNKRLLTAGLVLLLMLPIVGALVSRKSEYPHPWKSFEDQEKSIAHALRVIPPEESVIAPSYLVSHLSHRTKVRFHQNANFNLGLLDNKFILLNTKNPGALLTVENAATLLQLLTTGDLSKM